MPPKTKKPRLAEEVSDSSQTRLPRITKRLTAALLKVEAIARGLPSNDVPERKSELLSLLVEGSILISGTQSWKEVMSLREQVQKETAQCPTQRCDAPTGGAKKGTKDTKKYAKFDVKQFQDLVVNPSSKNRKRDGNGMKGFTVWCSSGYENDGWHSYEGEPDWEFDTTYMTKDEANARARYLFFWKNPWGLTPQEVQDDNNGVTEKIDKHGFAKFQVHPDDSEVWTVGIVPDMVYDHLPQASKYRHGNDDYSDYEHSGDEDDEENYW